MANLSNTYGITLVVNTSSTEYGGAGNNQFFGGSSDRIAMLRYGAPDELGENDVITLANYIGYFKADTAGDSDSITIGLVDGAWTTSTTDYATLYGYIEATTTTAALTTTTDAVEKTLAITTLLNTWAASPTSYSGIYFRCATMTMTRISATGQSITTTVQTITTCTAPTYTSLSKTAVDPLEPLTFSWSGASGGTLNSITGYIVEYQSSENGGSTWSAWDTFDTVYTANSYGSITVYGHTVFGGLVRVRVKTIGSAGASYYSDPTNYLAYTTNSPTACGAPSAANLSGSVAETAPTLTYSGASAGALNTITGYEIQYAESANGSTWGSWTALKTVSNTGTSGTTTVNLSSTRGYYRKYRIRTQGSAGSSYYSDWKETTSCRYNSLPTAPTVFTASPAVYVSGTIALAYSGATDADNNISTYNVQYATSADGTTWGSWVSLSNGATSHTPTLSPGHYIKYQVRTVDAFDQVSTSWKESNICGKNTAPASPVVTYPQNSKTIYNSRPRFLVTMGADPESHTMTLAASGFTLSRSSGLVGGSKIIARRTSAASAGAVSISATATDQYSESSSAATRDTTYAVPSFTDDPVESGTTAIKAAHVNELRTMIEAIRAYYGFGVNYFSNTTSYTTLSAFTMLDRNAHDYLDGFFLVGPESGDGGFRLDNVITGNGYWTVSFDVRGDQGFTLPIIVDICDSATSTFYTNSADTYERKTLTVNVTNWSSVTYHFVDFTSLAYAHYKFQNIRVERGATRTTPGNSMDWAETITAGVTKSRNWKTHIEEIQGAIDDVVTLVNGWDTTTTTNRVTAFDWLVPGVKPTADVMEQIRAMIPLL